METDDKKIVAVMFGGVSPEHEVSVITGIQVLENLEQTKFTGIPVYVAKDGHWYTSDFAGQIENYRNLKDVVDNSQEVTLTFEQELKFVSQKSGIFKKEKLMPIDLAFPCFHGGLGENGGIQGLLEIAGIPYVGSGILGSALGMDKVLMKQIFFQNDLPIAKYLWVYRSEIENDSIQIIQKIEHQLKYPLFVKPASAGSSIGINKAKNYSELANALEVAAHFDQKIIIEEGFEDAKEINISILGNSGGQLIDSVCEEVFAKSGFLNYDDKYQGNSGKSKGMVSTTRQIPAQISNDLTKKIADLAKLAFSSLNCAGLARIDFLVQEKSKELIVLEVNTIPGSLAYYLWEASGLKFKDLISKLIDLADERFVDSQKNIKTFSSNILENFKSGLKNSSKS